jgi:hypothetical protein
MWNDPIGSLGSAIRRLQESNVRYNWASGMKTGTGYFLVLFQRYREPLDVNLNSRGDAVLKKSSRPLFSASKRGIMAMLKS